MILSSSAQDAASTPLIRQMQADDVESLVQLWNDAGVSRPWNNPITDIAFVAKSPQATILVGFQGDRLVASIMVGEDGHRGWVYYLATAPDMRRQGLGRAMMEAAEAWLVARGMWKLQLLVRGDNAEAHGFYEQLGYKDVGTTCFQKIIAGDSTDSDAR